MQESTYRQSLSIRGHTRINVTQYSDGEVFMTVVDRRAMTIEDIALREYIDAMKVRYSFEHGWMYQGKEIPYLD